MAMIVAGLIIASCLLVVISRTLQRAVLIMLQAGLVVLALWAFVHMLRERGSIERGGAIHALSHD